MSTLSEVLSTRTREGDVYDRTDNGWVRCHACGHDCRIPPGAMGVCKVRFNDNGVLRVPWGYVAGVQCDPIEKKPFFHAWPGGLAYSFGMLGCDLHCSYCQNWVTSQALRDPAAVAPPRDVEPDALARDAIRQGARVVVSTYNEPLITVEWAVAVFARLARRAWRRGSSRMAMARRRSSSTSRRGSMSTRSISRASTTVSTASLAAACSRFSTRFARCTRAESGSRS